MQVDPRKSGNTADSRATPRWKRAVTASRRFAGYAASVLLALGLLAAHDASAAPKLKKNKQGKYIVENEIQFALKPEFAGTLSPVGNQRRMVNRGLLAGLHRNIKEVRGGHTSAENWLDGKPLPARIKVKDDEVPRIARSLTAVLKDGVDPEEALEELRRLPEVEWASLSTAEKPQLVPNDTHYNLQWAPPLILAEEAWDFTPGTTGIDIAVVDTGVDLDHPDLATIISYNRGFAGNPNGNAPTDGRPAADHGTHVAGIAAAIRNNGAGVAGMARAEIMAMGCSCWNAAENEYYICNSSDAINDAIANDAEIINCSFGTTMGASTVAAMDNARDNGVLVVCAAGNDGMNVAGIEWDAHSHPFIISNTEEDDTLRASSNWGNGIDLAAPGTGIYSTSVNGYTYKTGTSMSSPMVAGSAALVMSLNFSRMSDGAAKDILKRMAVDLGPGGKDSSYGWGRLSLPRSFLRVLQPASAFVGFPSIPLFATGAYANPYGTVQTAVDAVPAGGTIVLNAGTSGQGSYSYPTPITITKAVTLRAFPDRTVLIGN
jgi:subtilisin family serine protease